MEKQELKQRAEELREQGLSIRKIASALTDETGENISKSSVDRLLKQEVPQTVQGQEAETEAEVRPVEADLGEAFHVMPSRDKIKPSEAVIAATNQLRLQRLELERRQYERKLRLLDAEDELAQQEREQALNERRLRLQQGGANQSPEQAQALQIELANMQQTRAELEEQKAKLAEERHQLQMDALHEKIAELSSKLDGKQQLGASEFDVILRGMEHLSTQLSETRKDAMAYLNRGNTLQQFDPRRLSPQARERQGEQLARTAEAVASGKTPLKNPQANPSVMPTRMKQVICQTCQAPQMVDVAAIEQSAIAQGAKSGDDVWWPCSNRRCGALMNVSSLLSLPEREGGESKGGLIRSDEILG